MQMMKKKHSKPFIGIGVPTYTHVVCKTMQKYSYIEVNGCFNHLFLLYFFQCPLRLIAVITDEITNISFPKGKKQEGGRVCHKNDLFNHYISKYISRSLLIFGKISAKMPSSLIPDL